MQFKKKSQLSVKLTWTGKTDLAPFLSADKNARLFRTAERTIGRFLNCVEENKQVSAADHGFIARNHSRGGEQNRPALNRLYWGDNIAVVKELLDEFGAFVNLIYIDPPFLSGKTFRLHPPREQNSTQRKTRGEMLQAEAYDDRWPTNEEGWLSMLYPRLLAMKELLAPNGTIFVHVDYRTQALVKLVMDEVFGKHNFINELIWHYTGGGRSKRYFSRKHDTIFWYKKGKEFTFNINDIRIPYKKSSRYARTGIVSHAGKRYLPHPDGTLPDDVWDMPIVNPMAAERVEYPTQKPERLLQRIILAASNKDDIVADLFCGSGTTLVVAEKLGRRWIGCDTSRWAIHTTRKRLLSLSNSFPWELYSPINSYHEFYLQYLFCRKSSNSPPNMQGK